MYQTSKNPRVLVRYRWSDCLLRGRALGRWVTLSKGNDGYLTFVQVATKHAARPYHRYGLGLNHTAFRVKGRHRVDALRQDCLAQAITCLYDEKYPFAGGDDYYALFIEDPDRIKLMIVAF